MLERQPVEALARQVHHLLMTGHPSEADAFATDWTRRHPEHIAFRLQAAAAIEQRGDPEPAIAAWRAIVSDHPDHARALNQLALLLQASGEPVAALELAERAHRAAPQDPVIADTLGWLLVEAGQVERGTALLGPTSARYGHHSRTAS